MLFALLTLLVAVQTQPPKTHEPVQPVSAPMAAPAVPAAAPSPAPVLEIAPPEPEAEPEAEPELPTRQVCRYVEITGQRFPVRTCRTVTIHPDESH